MKLITALIFVMLKAVAYAQPNPAPVLRPRWLIGTWQLISVVNVFPSGEKIYPYGLQPKGLLVFDPSGTYSLQIYKSERAAVASGDKNTATAEENTALVQGCNAHYGSYVLDESRKKITFDIANASFPNWNGSQQERSFSYLNQQLSYRVTQTTQGGKSVIAEVTWEKEKKIKSP